MESIVRIDLIYEGIATQTIVRHSFNIPIKVSELTWFTKGLRQQKQKQKDD